jgi:hypothetical protein
MHLHNRSQWIVKDVTLQFKFKFKFDEDRIDNSIIICVRRIFMGNTQSADTTIQCPLICDQRVTLFCDLIYRGM